MTELSKAIFHLEQAILEHPNEIKLTNVLDKLKFVERMPMTEIEIRNVAKHYHDRDICSMLGGSELICPICKSK